MQFFKKILCSFILLYGLGATAQNKPNIIYILADDMGYGDLGCYGQEKIHTPNIDALAASGLKFTNHYAGAPVCAPSRCVLMTGRDPGHARVRGNYESGPHGFGAGLELRDEDITLGEVMKERGYVTAVVGKWGMGVSGTTGAPNRQGFDYSYGFLNQGHAHYQFPEYLFRNGKRIEIRENKNNKRGAYSNTLFTREALGFLEKNKKEPFFLYLAYTTPHAELLVPQDSIWNSYKGKFEEKPYVKKKQGSNGKDDFGSYASQSHPNAAYASCISHQDQCVGELIDYLKKNGLYENTVIMFSSDNGPAKEGGANPEYFNSNADMRGIKRDVYEGGIKVPFIVNWPGAVKPGTISDELCAFWDIMPTLADISGKKLEARVPTEGISLLPLIKGKRNALPDERPLYWEFHENKSSNQAIRMGKWKSVKMDPRGPVELYNIETDPQETNNVAGSHPEILARMKKALEQARTPHELWPLKSAGNVSSGTSASSMKSPGKNDKPNILWLVTEDMSPYLSCYGNKMISTPNLDKLASQGIRYTKAYSNGVQCSPARSTLMSGKYAVSLGTDFHRQKRPVNDSFYFPIYLRNAGYYCINNAKQDYNNMKTPANVWDASNGKASYVGRQYPSKPFFAVFNYGGTHMTRVATRTVAGRDERSVPISEVPVPPYIPDLPEVRDDISWNMDAVRRMDAWVGMKLKELEESGEAENTIVFFYADHGGTVPRGKAYVYETGSLVPMIAYFPPKWQHLANQPVPAVSDRLVSFVDLAPTVLSLAGASTPSFMVGHPFLGDQSSQPENVRDHVFTFRANQSLNYAPSRAITDGRYKLIWNFQSAYPNGTRQDYQWQMPAQQAWDKAFMEGKLEKGIYKKFWQPVPAFELYDVSKDSLEVHDLSNDPAFAKELGRMKTSLLQELYKQQDIGFIPPEFRIEMQKQGDLYGLVRRMDFPVNEVINAAAIASERSLNNLPALKAMLENDNQVIRYWGASGVCGLAKTGLLKKMPAETNGWMNNADLIPEARCLLAEAMVYTNDGNGLDYLIQMAELEFDPSLMSLQNLGEKARPVADRIEAILDKPKAKNKFYLRSILINCGRLNYDQLFRDGEQIEAKP